MASGVIFDGSIDNSGVTGVGANNIYSSSDVSVSGSDKSVEIVVKYSNQLPDPETVLAKYNLVAIVEEEIAAGIWRPFLSQADPFVKTEQGSTIVFVYGPGIFSFDDAQGFDMSDGSQIIAKEYRKQGNLPSKFRVCIIANQSVANGEVGAFTSVDANISYVTYS